MRRLAYDVVVVGAGPAGSSAAKAAARSGASVLLMDQRSNVGLPVQCAEFIPRLLLREVEVDPRCIAQRVDVMRTHLPDGDVSEVLSPGYILDRALFDKSLATAAIEEGVHFLSRTKVTSVEEGGSRAQRPAGAGVSPEGGSRAQRLAGFGVSPKTLTPLVCLAQQGDEQIQVEADILIGADGPRSCVGRSLGQSNTSFVQAMQYEVALNQESSATEVFFDREYPGGYAWLFPKGQTANVGVGLAQHLPHSSLREALDRFVDRLAGMGKVRGDGIVGASGGLIPVGGHLCTVVGNALLVGDAAGQTHPITGAGVAQAVVCGHIAGEVAGRAVQSRDTGVLLEYERRWKQIYATVLDRALAKRRLMESQWGSSNLHDLVRRCWVGFKEYAR